MEKGVTAPKGFLAAGVGCGIKKTNGLDLALVYSDAPCRAYGVYTKNRVKGHSLLLTRKNLRNMEARAIVINSGNANACIGPAGDRDALRMASETAFLLSLNPSDVLTASTGVIGHPLPMEKISAGIRDACGKLSINSHDAARAIMTTDTFPKEYSIMVDIQGRSVVVGGMAKGSGMIHPDMATMISLITTDAAIEKQALRKAVQESCDASFNRISVDGDTSVCDKYIVMANGLSGCPEILEGTIGYQAFVGALKQVAVELSKMIVQDGEGATKLISIHVTRAKTRRDAHSILNAVAKSPLVKTAFFGEDANWGRILTAMGYSGVRFDPGKASIAIGPLLLFSKGKALGFEEQEAKRILSSNAVDVHIDLDSGDVCDTMWTCDFSLDYVRINANYRT
ncbi:MAG: bifunctional glutamate N-acetyltransferase/amino-acid acetyltransferase ArgJ [Clostridia bacterium]